MEAWLGDRRGDDEGDGGLAKGLAIGGMSMKLVGLG